MSSRRTLTGFIFVSSFIDLTALMSDCIGHNNKAGTNHSPAPIHISGSFSGRKFKIEGHEDAAAFSIL